MIVLVFLAADLVRRRLDSHDRLNPETLWRWLFHQGRRVRAGHEAGVAVGLTLVFLPALVAALVVHLFDLSGLSVMAYPLEFVLLVFLMGIPGWGATLRAYREAWQRGDMQAAWHHIKDRLPAEHRSTAIAPEAMHLSLSRALMVAVFQRFFLIAFWYVVGGIGLAILARGLVALTEHWPQSSARPRFARLLSWVEWLPSRLLSLTFGIAGDLAGWLRVAGQALSRLGSGAGEVLMLSANGALTGYALDPARFSRIHPEEWTAFGGRSLSAIRGLLNRSMLVWVCALALLVIAGMV